MSVFGALAGRRYGTILADPRTALDFGKAAEHLVCADLLLAGEQTYLSDQGLPYDVVVDQNGWLVRIQVKATCAPRNLNASGRVARLGYSFSARRRGKGGQKRLTNEQCDVMALVALDIRIIAYFPVNEIGTTCQLMPPGHEFKGKHQRNKYRPITGYPFKDAIARLRRSDD